METLPDRHFKYICHVVDHFSKSRVLFPLKTKSTKEVVKDLMERVFSYSGLPIVFYSDNGSEFVNSMIESIWQLLPYGLVNVTL